MSFRLGVQHPLIIHLALQDGASLLTTAVECGNPIHVRWLAEVVQVPLQQTNHLGMTALDVARFKDYGAIENLLLELENRCEQNGREDRGGETRSKVVVRFVDD